MSKEGTNPIATPVEYVNGDIIDTNNCVLLCILELMITDEIGRYIAKCINEASEVESLQAKLTAYEERETKLREGIEDALTDRQHAWDILQETLDKADEVKDGE